MSNKILIANRGEIAIRIIKAATELGYETVAVYSDDQDKSHCMEATESIKLKTASSFLNPQHIIDAAKSAKAVAIHPGYGFLSESTELAEQCKSTGIIFIGPSSSCISAVGDKVSARQVAEQAGVPVIPGTRDSVSKPEQVYAFAKQFGYPIMLKARDGGGGRGIRMVHEASEVTESLQRCMNESPSKQVFIEKAIIGAKHIEVQILGDSHGNVIHLFERDCSIQRRYQKILEFAPCPCLSTELRSQIHQAAIQIAKHIHYNSAGTVEFLVRPETNEFYFLEVNPRVQVEHTISEQITHVDIVQAQIKIAFGENLNQLSLYQNSIQPNRLVAIQARIVAENPLNNNMLSVGKIKHIQFPQGHGIRIDTWIHEGCVVLPTFDSLLAKLIVTGQSYEDAIAKLNLALHNTIIEGVDTNLQFLIAMVNESLFIGDKLSHVHIKSLEEKMDSLLELTKQIQPRRSLQPSAANQSNAPTSLQFKPGDAFNIELSDPNTNNVEAIHSFQIETISTNNFPDQFDAQIQTSISSLRSPLAISVSRKAALGSTLRRKVNPRSSTDIGTPVTGMVVEINVQEGDQVTPGQQLFVMSAMKMETVVKATIAGSVKTIFAKGSDLIEANDIVIELSKESKL